MFVRQAACWPHHVGLCTDETLGTTGQHACQTHAAKSAPALQIAQLRITLERMHNLAQRAGGQVSCLLAGDFNLTPASPLYRFVCEGSFDCDSADRRSLSGQMEQTRAERRRARAAQAALEVGIAQGLLPEAACSARNVVFQGRKTACWVVA